MGVEVKKGDDGSITLEADRNLSKDATVKVELKSTKNPNVKAEITVTIKQLKTPNVGIGFTGYLKTTDNDWFKEVKNDKATVTYTKGSETRDLKRDQSADAYGNKNYVYYTNEGFEKSVKFAVEDPAIGDIYRIKVDGYKTVKLVSRTSGYSPSFDKAEIE